MATSSSPREGLGRLGVKLYRYRALLKRHWWILATTIGLGLAYQGWVVAQKPRLYEWPRQLNIREERVMPSEVGKVNSTVDFTGPQLNRLKTPEGKGRARQRVALEFPNMAAA